MLKEGRKEKHLKSQRTVQKGKHSLTTSVSFFNVFEFESII
jgi:hypothetical protein